MRQLAASLAKSIGPLDRLVRERDRLRDENRTLRDELAVMRGTQTVCECPPVPPSDRPNGH